MSTPIQFTPPEPSALGELLSGYHVHDLVATGGMGAVYRATHISLDRPVAIKVLPEEFADQSFQEQFQAEARAMAKLNHPNLVAIYDFGKAGNLPFIVMEFVAGKSLYYSAYKKAIEEATAVRLVREICDGLAQAHDNNIIHRDIKPANILMDPEAHAKIGDFGLASTSDGGKPEHDSEDIVYGTPGYAAPEIIHNPAAIGKPSDIFAVGVILYELLTGQLPDPTNPRPASRIAHCDPRLDRIIRKATHNNPAMRYQDAGEMAADLHKLGSTPQGHIGSPSPRKRSGPVSLHSGHKTQQIGSKSQQLGIPEKTTPILTKPKKITGKIAARTSESYSEVKNPGHEVKVSRNRERGRPEEYTGPHLATAATAAHSLSSVPPHAPSKSGAPVFRNLVIIAILAPLLYVLWNKYQQDRASNLEQRRLITEQNERNKDPLNQFDSAILNSSGTSSRPPEENSGGKDPSPPLTPQLRDPMDQLTSLQAKLASGDRDTFPDTAVERGNTVLMPIAERMTWGSASYFAEQHGAYLAAPTTTSELGWLSDNLPEGQQEIWIGAGAQGEQGWTWVTGDDWTFSRQPSTDLGHYAVLTSAGAIKSRPNAATFAFVLEWNKNGQNPATLASQLERLADTLSSPAPEWLPGTIRFRDRHYYFAHQPATWREAQSVSKAGGGHLAVCSDRVEAASLRDLAPRLLPSGESAWIGGLRVGDDWTWSTGEPFLTKDWRPGFPDPKESKRGLRLTSSSSSGWTNANPFDYRESSGWIIEWSSDAEKGASSGAGEKTDTSNEISRLQKIARSQLSALALAHRRLLKDNQKNFEWEVVSWYNTLPKGRQNAYKARIQGFRNRFDKEQDLPRNLKMDSMPPEVVTSYEGAIRRQNRHEATLERNIMNLRRKYLGRLREAQSAARSRRREDLVQAYQQEIKALGQSVIAFRKHFES